MFLYLAKCNHWALMRVCGVVPGPSLYWHIGKRNFGPNSVNIGAALFMWTILPAFAATAYMPALVVERALFYRRVPLPPCETVQAGDGRGR